MSKSEPEDSNQFSVEVVYCQPEKQTSITLQVVAGCSAEAAVKLANLRVQCGGKGAAPIGIFGKQVSPDTLLKPGDRVEIYRPLLLSPTDARRLRAKTLSES